MVFVGVMCLRLNDLKGLIAYSSVSHMAFVLTSLVALSLVSFKGALLISLGHGLVSSGLFCFVGLLFYLRCSRRIYLNKGIVLKPFLALLFFFVCVINFSAPPSFLLLSEIYMLVSVGSQYLIILFFLPLGMYLVVVYSIHMYSSLYYRKSVRITYI